MNDFSSLDSDKRSQLSRMSMRKSLFNKMSQVRRDDIQIYRGTAVIVVLMYHLRLPIFSSGFLGVDMFFVISGYILASQFAGSCNIKDFYIRRLRRIVPLYVVVLVLTLLCCFFLTPYSDFYAARDQSIWSILFLSNFDFWLNSDYFGKSDFNIFLHFWSLSVEVQFYAVFPFLMFLGNRSQKWWIFLAIASLILCFAVLLFSSKSSFFLTPMRLWQFLIGMLAAATTSRALANGLAGAAGFSAVLTMLFIPIDTLGNDILFGHPGVAALAISVATAFGLWQGLPSLLTAIPPMRALKYIGDRSYSIYVVHFPVLALISYRPFEGLQGEFRSGITTIVAMVLTLALSFLAYELIERNSKKLFSPLFLSVGLASFASILIALPAIKWSMSSKQDRYLSIASTDRPPMRCGKYFEYLYPSTPLCSFAKTSGPSRKIMLIGDSHADALKPLFIRLIGDRPIRLDFAAPNHVMIEESTSPEWLAREAKHRRTETIFIHYSARNLTLPFLRRIDAAFESHPSEVVFLEPIPIYRRSVLALIREMGQSHKENISTTIQEYEKETSELLKYMRSARNFESISTAPIFCMPNCRLSSVEGYPFYSDDTHLTSVGANQFRSILENKLYKTEGEK